MKVILVRRENPFRDYNGHEFEAEMVLIEAESLFIEKLEDIDITDEEYDILEHYYRKSRKFILLKLVESQQTTLELDLKKALAKEKERLAAWEREKEKDIAKKKASAKNRKVKQIEKAEKLLREAGKLK